MTPCATRRASRPKMRCAAPPTTSIAPGTSTSARGAFLPQPFPGDPAGVEEGRHRDHQQKGSQRLLMLLREREDRRGVEAGHHDPDHGEEKPELPPERAEKSWVN